MPLSAVGAAVPRQDLVGSFLEFSEQGFIGEEILGIETVAEMTGTYGRLPIEAFTTLGASNVKRRPRGKISESTFEPESDTWALGEWAHGEFIDRQDLRRYGTWFDGEQVAVRRVSEIIGLAYESEVASLVHNTSTFGTTAAGSFNPSTHKGFTTANKWDTSSGTPIDDVQLAVEAVRRKTGRVDGVVQLSFRAMQKLGTNQQIVDRIKNINPVVNNGVIDAPALAAVLGVSRVIVGGSQYNSAKPGQDASLAQVWADSRVLYFLPKRGGIESGPHLGCTFALSGDDAIGVTVEEQSNPPGRFVSAYTYRQPKLHYAEAGCLISGVL